MLYEDPEVTEQELSYRVGISVEDIRELIEKYKKEGTLIPIT